MGRPLHRGADRSTQDGTDRDRDALRYRRAVRRAFATVTFYREQCAAAGRLLDRPVPTPAGELPQPPHTLCPFARPWSPEREPSLGTPELRPLARVLRMAGCREPLPVLEVRDALLDRTRLPRRHPWHRPVPYRVLLSPAAVVASPGRRAELNQAAVAAAGGGWVVVEPDQLAAIPEAAGARRLVHRLPVATAAGEPPAGDPAVLYEPGLGYLGAWVPECRRFHVDTPRVYAHHRDGAVLTFSLPHSRRPTLLDILPPGTERLAVRRCDRHGGAVLAARDPAGR